MKALNQRKALNRWRKSHPRYQHFWRLAHRKLRNEERDRYYHKHEYGVFGGRIRWSPGEERLLFRFPGTDPELGKRILRSVKAIQVHRCRLNKI